MQHKEVDCATISVANGTGMGGTATADEVHPSLRIRKERNCIAGILRYGLGGAAIALLAFHPTTADSGTIPTGFLGASTLGSNGDQNPYGVAFVPSGFPSGGALSPGNILVSNFNNGGTPPLGNIQGTGTTIVQVRPDGGTSTFFIETFVAGQQGGLTTALGVLERGFVVVGQVPNSDGTATGRPTAGSLLFIDKSGTSVTYTNPNLQGPWDLVIQDDFDHAKIFVSNVLNGTVVRLNVSVGSAVTVNSVTVIANGYAHSLDPTVFALGPTGLAYDQENDILYVASTQDNEIRKILNAGARTTPVSKGILVYSDPKFLRGPLGLVLAPNGNLLTANGDAPTVNPPPATPPPLPSEIVEFTKEGNFIGQLSIDPVAGAAFGIAIVQGNDSRVHFAAVNDDDADLIMLNLNNQNIQ
jgi:hypothetical protein